MPKRKRPDEKPEEQFKRFVETAREHGVDESGKPLDEAFDRVKTRAPPPDRRKPRGQQE